MLNLCNSYVEFMQFKIGLLLRNFKSHFDLSVGQVGHTFGPLFVGKDLQKNPGTHIGFFQVSSHKIFPKSMEHDTLFGQYIRQLGHISGVKVCFPKMLFE